jgi:hypothetical protein
MLAFNQLLFCTGREMIVPKQTKPVSKWYYRLIGKYGTPSWGLGFIAASLFCSIKF